MKIKYKLKNQYFSSEEMVDVMNIGGKMRYADSEGNQDTLPDAEIVGLRSETPCKVVVKREEGNASITFPLLKFVQKEDDVIYLSGLGYMGKLNGEIVRVRKHLI